MDENLIYAKEWKDKPVIEITNPETITVSMGPDSVACQDIYVYDNSHVIFKGQDLGSFTELVEMKKELDRLKKIDTIAEYCKCYADIDHCYAYQNEEDTRVAILPYDRFMLLSKTWIELEENDESNN